MEPSSLLNAAMSRGRGTGMEVLPDFPSGFFQNWVEHTELAILITDPEGAVRWSNPAFTRMCLYSMHEIIGRRPGRLLGGPLTEESSRQVLRQAIREGKPCVTRITNYKKNAIPYVAEIHLEPIRNSVGELLGFLALEQDVTRMETRERELGELSASIYRQLLARMGNAEAVPAGS